MKVATLMTVDHRTRSKHTRLNPKKLMNTQKYSQQVSIVCLVALAALASVNRASATSWAGSSLTTNGWSDSLNWDTSIVPGPSDAVTFSIAGSTNAQATVNNVVDANYTINSFTYSEVSSNGYHTTLIGPGLSLNINGS